MSMIETVSDIENSFLSRREITCNFQGLGGKLKRKEAIEMITKEFNLSDKTVIAINMKNQTGRPNVTGMFYVYDSEELAKKQVNPTVFKRLERQAKKDAEAAPAEEKAADAPAEEKAADAPAEEKAADAPAEEKAADAPAEEKAADAPAEEEKKE
jgi:ribosomal protein S24E